MAGCLSFNFNLNFNPMKTVTMLEFRRDAEGILRRVGKGERFVLSHRGQPAARLEPVAEHAPADPTRDPFLSIVRRAKPSPKGKTPHADIDRILYGRR
jgi:prevent-host-death family protein